MSLAGRLQRLRDRRQARALGQRAALGLVVPIDLTRERPGAAVSAAPACPRCRRPGQIEVVDVPEARGHLRCHGCGVTWEVPLEERHPTSH